jgi:hypothetical protein
MIVQIAAFAILTDFIVLAAVGHVSLVRGLLTRRDDTRP